MKQPTIDDIDLATVFTHLKGHISNNAGRRGKVIIDGSAFEQEIRSALNQSITQHLSTFKPPPNPDENYDITIDFINKSKQNAVWAVAEAVRQVKKTYLEVPLSEVVETVGTTSEDMYRRQTLADPQEQMQTVYQEEVVQRVITAFSQILTRFESLLFASCLNGTSVPAIRKQLATEGFDDMPEHTIRRVINTLQFRLACFAAHSSIDVYSDRVLLKGLNRFPSHCKKNFGERKLTSLPSDMQLMDAATLREKKEANKKRGDIPLEDVVYKYDPNAKPAKGASHVFESRKAFDGTMHRYAVVRINKHGYAHDVTSREVRDLYSEA